MIQKISWDSSYSVGNAILDQQHQQLLAICAELADCLADDSRRGREQFHSILHDLSIYADTHFCTEETLLSQCAYPLLDEQKAEHDEYRNQLCELLFSATEGDINKVGLQRYLNEWWLHHILESDMKYRNFLQSKPV